LSSLESIRNYARLAADIGTAGQPRPGQFRLIADAGFETVINIAMPDHSDSIAKEGKLVTELGMNYFHLPVAFDKPRADQVKQFCDLMAAQQGRKIFAHCIMNYRVSVFMFHYLCLVRGYSPQRARSPIYDIWEIEPQWQAIMDMDAAALGFSSI